MPEDILQKLSEYVACGEEEEALNAVEAAFAQGFDPLTILNQGAAKGMDIVSDQYNNGEAFLPELVIAGDTMSAVIKIIFSHMDAVEKEKNKQGTIVFGQARGDVHDIGKNVACALLAVHGFDVHNIGIDVEVKTFAEKALELKADIVAISTLLTTSMPYLEDTLQYIKDTGNREKFFYIVGGGPITPEFAARIGADGWGRNAVDCVNLCKRLMQRGNPGQGQTVIVDSEA